MSEGDGISNRPGPASAAEPSMEEILASIRRILSEEENAAKQPDEDSELLLDASMRVAEQDLPSSATQPPEPAPGGTLAEEAGFAHDLPHEAEALGGNAHFAAEPALESVSEIAPEAGTAMPYETLSNAAFTQTTPPNFAPEPQSFTTHGEVWHPQPSFASAPQENAPAEPEPDYNQTYSAEPPHSDPAQAEPQNAWPAQEFEPIQAAQDPFQPQPQPEKDISMNEQVQSPEGLVGEQAASDIANSVGALVRSVSSERSASLGRPGITIEDIVREEVKPVLKAWLDTHLPSLVERVVRAEINRVMDNAQR